MSSCAIGTTSGTGNDDAGTEQSRSPTGQKPGTIALDTATVIRASIGRTLRLHIHPSKTSAHRKPCRQRAAS
jgi:hypothetical protein